MTTIPTSAPSATPDSKGGSFLERRKARKEEQALAEWIKQEYERCKRARTTLEAQWYKNIEMYLGNQWVEWGRGKYAGKLVVPKAPPWRARLTINRIRPVIRTELSRVTSQKPNASVVPASSEDEDLFAAQAGEQVWESTYSRLKVNRTLRSTMWWTLITGTGYMKAFWNDDKVDRINNVMGDLEIQMVSPFHIFVPDLTLEHVEEQPYVIHAQVIPVEKVKMMYPDLSFEPTVVAQDEIVQNSRLNIRANNKPDSCLVLEMWLHAGTHKDYPNGGMIRVIDNHVVANYTDGCPYDHGQYPFIKFSHIPTGKYYADSVIVDIDSLQREYNRTRSQIVEAKNRMSKPQLTAPEGSIDPSRITSEPGQVILYKPGFNPPQPLPLQSLPPYVLEEVNRILMDIEDLTAQHQVSKGNTPPGVTAATAISYLQEKDDSVMSHTYASIEEGFEELAQQVIALIVQFWDVERIVKVTGTDGSFDALALKGSDLATATDVRMEAGSALPTSKAARQAFIMDMMKMNFIPPDKGLEMMEIGGVQKLYEQIRVDERQAQRENLRMKEYPPEQIAQHQQQTQMAMQMAQGIQQAAQQQTDAIPPELASDLAPQPGQTQGNLALAGQDPSQIDVAQLGLQRDPQTGQVLAPPPLVPVNTWDNHAIHIDVHNRFRKSQSFELMPQEVKDLFEQHVQLHAAALNQSAMNAQMTGGMGVPPLAPNEGGQPPAPDQGGSSGGPPPLPPGPMG